jgi:hypothetical protein
MDIQQFALLSQHWTMQLAGNPTLAAQFAAMVTGGTPAPAATPPAAPQPGPESGTGLTI